MDLTFVAKSILDNFTNYQPSREAKLSLLKLKLEAAYKQGVIDTQYNIKSALGIENV